MQQVAVIRTRRHVHVLLDDEGTALAEFCDDRVSAEVLDESEPASWREWEVELVEGDTALLAAVAALFEDRAAAAPTGQAGQGARRPGALPPEQVLPTPSRKARPRRWCRPGCANRSR